MFLLLAAAACGASCGKAAPPPGGNAPPAARRMQVAAAASLRDLLEATAPDFRASRPGCELVFSFDASSVLSRQISEGGPFAVFLSADADSVDRLGAAAKPGTRRVFLANRLCMVGPDPGPEFTPQSVDTSHRAALCGPEVPAGKAWRKYLEGKGWLSPLEPFCPVATNVLAAMTQFEAGAVEYAFVYVTDAKASKRAHRTWVPPDGPVTTYVAVETAATAGEDAAAFLTWIDGPAFRKAALAAGFQEPPAK